MNEQQHFELLMAERKQLAEDRADFREDKQRFERWLTFVADRMAGAAVAASNGQSVRNGSANGSLAACNGRQSFGRVIDGKPVILWENAESKAERAATNGAT